MSHPVDSALCQQIGHTLPGRVAVFAEHWPERPALREKWRGIWRSYSWQDYLTRLLAVSEALQAQGLRAGDRIAILSDNRPEWLFADLGAQALGLLSAGIYTTNPAADVAYVLNHCRAAVVFVEDQEQADKVLESPEPLPHLRHIVVMDPAGMRDYRDPRLVIWEPFLAGGLARAQARSAASVRAQLQALEAEQPACIIYTSGTTARPKGVLLTHRNMLGLSHINRSLFEASEDDSLLSYLPLCHVAEKIFSQFIPLTSGAVVHFGESLDTVRQDLAEVAPSVFLGVPRIWEKMHAGVEVAMRNSTPLKRGLYRWALRQGQARVAGTGSAPGFWLADRLVFRALRERLGLGRVRLAVSGAAPVAPELLAWYHAIGVAIMEGYGLSESSGLSHINLPGDFALGSVGRSVPGTECRIAEDGEVLLRGPHIFSGYLDNPEATREARDAEGWLHTGDLGRVDERGHLYIIGRKKEILITAGGKNLSPAKIENALKTSPYIKEAASVADGRAYVTALIQIEPDMVGDWATRRQINFTSFEDLTRKPEVVRLIGAEVDRINQAMLARVEQVRAFRLLPKELHQDDGEVTATQKLKRHAVYEKFAALIDDMYRASA
ncbi:MAG: AMP-dependent synthetase/ligase [Gammaproteobacteria bacterium]